MRIVLCSHLLRDVEETCEEVLILKQGRIVHYSNLEEERKANRRFVELETCGDDGGFVDALETARLRMRRGGRRPRQDGAVRRHRDSRHLSHGRRARTCRLRRLNYRRDTLEDIFLKAMEARGSRRGSTNGRL